MKFKRTLAMLIAAVMLIGMIPLNLLSIVAETDLSTIQAITLDTAVAVTLGQEEQSVLKFTPEETAYYAFYSRENSADTQGWITDLDGNELVYNDDGAGDLNFKAVYNMIAGTTYLLKSSLLAMNMEGSYEVLITKLPEATEIYFENEYISGVVGGESEPIEVLQYPEFSIPVEVTWSSKDESVATVDEGGRVTFIKVGTTEISAVTESGLKATLTVSVEPTFPIRLSTPTETTIENIEKGIYYAFECAETGYYAFYSESEDCDPKCIVYDSDMYHIGANDDKSTRDYDFETVLCFEEGNTYILFVTMYDDFDVNTFNVYLTKTGVVSDIDFEYDTVEASFEDYFTINPNVSPERAYVYSWEWESSDPSVAEVDMDGGVSVYNYGTTVITAKAYPYYDSEEYYEASYTLNVAEPTSIEGGDSFTVSLNQGTISKMYVFTPDTDVTYEFYSTGASGAFDPYLRFHDFTNDMYDEFNNYLDNNFSMQYDFVAGNTYYFKVLLNSYSDPGTFDVHFGPCRTVIGMEVISVPDKEFYIGYVEDYMDLYGTKLRLELSDGSQVEWNFGDNDYVFGDAIYWEYYEDVNIDGIVTFGWGDVTCEVVLKLVEPPVESIEVIKLPDRPFYFGDVNCGFMDEIYYVLNVFDYSGLTIKINYKDGTSETVTLDTSRYGSIINGYSAYVKADFRMESPGKAEGCVEYLGEYGYFEFDILASEIESLELKNTPPFDYNYYPDFTGSEIVVNYKDGTSKTVEVTDENTRFYMDDYSTALVTMVEIDGAEAKLYLFDGDVTEYRVEFIDKSYHTAPAEYANNPSVDGVDITNITENGLGMNIHLTYNDGTTETLTVTEHYSYYVGHNLTYNFGRTERGFVWYELNRNAYYEEDDKQYSYIVYLMGYKVKIDIEQVGGDANGDGKLTTDDAVYLAYAIMFDDDRYPVRIHSDFDGDGYFDETDAIHLLYYVMFGAKDYPIYE